MLVFNKLNNKHVWFCQQKKIELKLKIKSQTNLLFSSYLILVNVFDYFITCFGTFPIPALWL